MTAIKRMWINQPSAHQALHKLHGVNVLALLEAPSTYRIYFLSGNIVSQRVPALALSEGWREGNPSVTPADLIKDALVKALEAFRDHMGEPHNNITEELYQQSDAALRLAKGAQS